MLFTLSNRLEVIEEHQHYSGNLFFAEEVHDLGDLLDKSKLVVLEVLIGKLMVAQDPEHANHIVSNLAAVKARTFKHF